MDYNFLHSVFPNYTLSMYQGNEPSDPNHSTHISGSPIQHWSWEYGCADTYLDENGYVIINADVKLPSELHVFICGDRLEMSYISSNIWKWINKDGGMMSIWGYKYPIPEAEIRRMMNKELPDSVIWQLIKKRMWELFETAEYKGDYRE